MNDGNKDSTILDRWFNRYHSRHPKRLWTLSWLVLHSTKIGIGNEKEKKSLTIMRWWKKYTPSWRRRLWCAKERKRKMAQFRCYRDVQQRKTNGEKVGVAFARIRTTTPSERFEAEKSGERPDAHNLTHRCSCRSTCRMVSLPSFPILNFPSHENEKRPEQERRRNEA